MTDKEKKIVFGETEGIDSFGNLAFLIVRVACDVDALFLSDDSSLRDFVSFELRGEEREKELKEMEAKIEAAYPVQLNGEKNLLVITRTVHRALEAQKNVH